MENPNTSLAADLDRFLLANRMRWYDKEIKVPSSPVPWLQLIQNQLQDPEVFAPIMIMLDESLAIEDSVEREKFIRYHLSKGYKEMCSSGEWIYKSPKSG